MPTTTKGISMTAAHVDSNFLPGGYSAHLASGHPLAALARSRCLAVHGPSWGRVGNTACGACWERVIRDDERCAVQFDLPRTLETDADYVDVIAVERACSGERVHLTPAERQAAVQVLVDRGYSATRIARRLRISGEVASDLLADLLAELDVHAAAPIADTADPDAEAA